VLANRQDVISGWKGHDTLFCWAARNGHADIVSMVYRLGVTRDALQRALTEAADYGQAETVRVLLTETSVDATANSHIALRYATWHKHQAVVELLSADKN